MKENTITKRPALRVLASAVFYFLCADLDAAPSLAEGILNRTGFRGGLIVHVGCDGGHLTAALKTKTEPSSTAWTTA